MSKFLDRLSQGVLLYDGAMGTRLYDKGIFVNRCFEEVCLSNPNLVEEIHKEYIEAGAMVIETNSFGANRFKLKGYNLMDKVADINKAAAQIARKAAGPEVFVAGAVGPTGALIQPLGQMPQEDAKEIFREQITALVEGGVDLILLETFKNIDELILAAGVAKSVNPDLPVQGQFSMGIANPEYYDEYKKQAASMAQRLQESPNIDVIGFNCSVGPADSLEILNAIGKVVKKPLAVMPNAGFPKEIEDRQIYMATPDYFAEFANRFVDGGAAIIGGCCGTNPEHIHKMGVAALAMDSGRNNKEFHSLEVGVEEKDPTALSNRSRLGHDLASGKWVSMVELVPPMGTDLSGYVKKAEELYRNGVDYINVPDGPRASSRISALITCLELQRQTHIEPIFHMCTRDKNLIGLQSELLGCEAVGLRNMLLITGDPPKVGRYPDVTGVFDVDSIGLTSLVQRLNHGVDLGGHALAQTTNFVKGCGVNPASPTIESEIERAYQKAEAGAEYFITQPVYDLDLLSDFIRKIEQTGVPMIIGVWPLASYKNALFLNNEVPGVTIPDSIMRRMEKHTDKEEARRDGVRISREIIENMRSLVQGVQVSPPFGKIQTALDVLATEFE